MSVFEVQILSLVVSMLCFQWAFLPASIAKVSGLGWKWAMSMREKTDFARVAAWGGRAERAHNNLKDNLPPFVVAVLLLLILQIQTESSAVWCLVFLASRFLHFLSYVLGYLWPRVLGFVGGIAAVMALFLEIALQTILH